MNTVFMFSGQGAQAAGMGKSLYDNFNVCRKIFDEADEALGFSISELCFYGGEKLDDTEYAQPAILTMSAACLALAESAGINCSYAAGLSLGEYSALYASKALSFKDAVKLVKKRGQFMSKAMPPGFGAMSAILNLSGELTEKACRKASDENGCAVIANFNAPGQIVISGELNAVERAEKLCVEYGAKRTIRLNVSGAFHSPYLDGAASKLKEELEKTVIKPMQMPVVTNVTADIIPSEKDIAELLYRQIKSSVKWEQSVTKLISLGANTFVELGPGKTLCGFVKKINKEARVFNIEDHISFEKTLNELGIER